MEWTVLARDFDKHSGALWGMLQPVFTLGELAMSSQGGAHLPELSHLPVSSVLKWRGYCWMRRPLLVRAQNSREI